MSPAEHNAMHALFPGKPSSEAGTECENVKGGL